MADNGRCAAAAAAAAPPAPPPQTTTAAAAAQEQPQQQQPPPHLHAASSLCSSSQPTAASEAAMVGDAGPSQEEMLVVKEMEAVELSCEAAAHRAGGGGDLFLAARGLCYVGTEAAEESGMEVGEVAVDGHDGAHDGGAGADGGGADDDGGGGGGVRAVQMATMEGTIIFVQAEDGSYLQGEGLTQEMVDQLGRQQGFMEIMDGGGGGGDGDGQGDVADGETHVYEEVREHQEERHQEHDELQQQQHEVQPQQQQLLHHQVQQQQLYQQEEGQQDQAHPQQLYQQEGQQSQPHPQQQQLYQQEEGQQDQPHPQQQQQQIHIGLGPDELQRVIAHVTKAHHLATDGTRSTQILQVPVSQLQLQQHQQLQQAPQVVVQSASQQLQGVAHVVLQQQQQDQQQVDTAQLVQGLQVATLASTLDKERMMPPLALLQQRPTNQLVATTTTTTTTTPAPITSTATQIFHIQAVGQDQPQQFLLCTTGAGAGGIRILSQRQPPPLGPLSTIRLVSGVGLTNGQRLVLTSDPGGQQQQQQLQPEQATVVTGHAGNGRRSAGNKHLRRLAKIKTRSGRISRPPLHKIKDYKFIRMEDLADGHQSDSDDYSDYSVEEAGEEERKAKAGETQEERLHGPLTFTVKPKNFRCQNCDKSYIGRGGLARHYRLNPTHGQLEPLADEQDGAVAVTVGGDDDSGGGAGDGDGGGDGGDGGGGGGGGGGEVTGEAVPQCLPVEVPVDDGPAACGVADAGSLKEPEFVAASDLAPDEQASVSEPQQQQQDPSAAAAVAPVLPRRPGRPPKNAGGPSSQEQQLQKKRTQLRELLKGCDDEDLVELVLPRLTRILTLWQFLLKKVEKGLAERPRFPDVYREFETLHGQVKRMAEEHFSSPPCQPPQPPLQINNTQVAQSLGLGPELLGLDEGSSTVGAPLDSSTLRYELMLVDPAHINPTSTLKHHSQEEGEDEPNGKRPRMEDDMGDMVLSMPGDAGQQMAPADGGAEQLAATSLPQPTIVQLHQPATSLYYHISADSNSQQLTGPQQDAAHEQDQLQDQQEEEEHGSIFYQLLPRQRETSVCTLVDVCGAALSQETVTRTAGLGDGEPVLGNIKAPSFGEDDLVISDLESEKPLGGNGQSGDDELGVGDARDLTHDIHAPSFGDEDLGYGLRSHDSAGTDTVEGMPDGRPPPRDGDGKRPAVLPGHVPSTNGGGSSAHVAPPDKATDECAGASASGGGAFEPPVALGCARPTSGGAVPNGAGDAAVAAAAAGGEAGELRDGEAFAPHVASYPRCPDVTGAAVAPGRPDERHTGRTPLETVQVLLAMEASLEAPAETQVCAD